MPRRKPKDTKLEKDLDPDDSVDNAALDLLQPTTKERNPAFSYTGILKLAYSREAVKLLDMNQLQKIAKVLKIQKKYKSTNGFANKINSIIFDWQLNKSKSPSKSKHVKFAKTNQKFNSNQKTTTNQKIRTTRVTRKRPVTNINDIITQRDLTEDEDMKDLQMQDKDKELTVDFDVKEGEPLRIATRDELKLQAYEKRQEALNQKMINLKLAMHKAKTANSKFERQRLMTEINTTMNELNLELQDLNDDNLLEELKENVKQDSRYTPTLKPSPNKRRRANPMERDKIEVKLHNILYSIFRTP